MVLLEKAEHESLCSWIHFSARTPPPVLNAVLIDGHDGTQAEASSQPTNSYSSGHVVIGGGDNLAIHYGVSEESGHMSHFVGGSIPPSLRSLAAMISVYPPVETA